MQIVIEIPDKTYEYYVKLANKSDEQLSAYERLILRGTPLPKGHGRLIDADKALDYFTTNMNWFDDDDDCIDDSDERRAIFKDYFDRVPTIIEAGKEIENETIFL